MTRSSLVRRSTLVALAISFFKGLSLVHAGGSFNPSFQYGKDKVRGVNAGGWLVPEPWITPSLFDKANNKSVVDEWTLTEALGKDAALKVLKKHWDTFFTEKDFAAIAAAGLNHVRIPIGSWAFDVAPGEPWVSGQLDYLSKGINWARTYKLKVIIDLHGVPGSQNGFDNSGQRMDRPQWASKPENIKRTNAIIKTIATKFANQSDVVSVIGPLNEPAGWFPDILNATRQLWLDSYESIRFPNGKSKPSNTLELISDAFQSYSSWSGFMAPPKYQGVAMETHFYEVFDSSLIQQNESEFISTACAKINDLAGFHLPSIVGEWSPVRTDCAKYLNGIGRGIRYEGTLGDVPRQGSCKGLSGSADTFSEDYKEFLRQFWEAQTLTFEKVAGWIQWTWKTEKGTGEEWSYSKGLEHGWIPQDPTDRLYPDICG